MRYSSKPVGWRNESYRHYLAAKGISTKKYSANKYLATPFDAAIAKWDKTRSEQKELAIEQAEIQDEVYGKLTPEQEAVLESVERKGYATPDESDAYREAETVKNKITGETGRRYLIISTPEEAREFHKRMEWNDMLEAERAAKGLPQQPELRKTPEDDPDFWY